MKYEIGCKVEVISANLFKECIGKIGTVFIIDSDMVCVEFSDNKRVWFKSKKLQKRPPQYFK